MKNRVAILAGVVWHQYANLVFSFNVAAGETCQRYEYWLAEDFGVMAIPTQQT